MTLDLAKLRAETLALIEGTTPGPWVAYGQSIKANGWCDTITVPVLCHIARADDTEQADYEGRVWGVAGLPEANARLIAAAPALAADTMRLLDEIERLTDENERLRYVLDGVARAIDTGRNEPLHIWRGQIEIARAALAKGGPDDL